jgi:cytochrome bd ubiquinol oxidase subunit I
MEWFTALNVARIQFAFTVSFHIVFPAFTIGLASYLAVLEGLWLATGRNVYQRLFRFWARIFAVAFGMGVVSGVVMSYQFGTNWSSFSDLTGPVLGPLLGYEVLSAFFLEAGFLGVMLFGMNRVGRGLHFFATLMVALGTLMSAFWILSANSWMQTPAGHVVNAAGQFVPEDWWAVVFNPSFPYRFAHMVLAAYLATAFIVGGVAAYHLLRDSAHRDSRIMFSMAMWMATLVAPLQIVAGDLHALNTAEHQPMKVAAMEAHFETRRPQPLILLGIPDPETATVRYALEIPKGSSILLGRAADAEVPGLDRLARKDWPHVPLLFYSFRIMVGLGLIMAGIGLWSLVQRLRGRLYDTPSLLRMARRFAPAGLVAMLCGWVVTEVGRQPYTVYGLLRTAESVSPVELPAVVGSFAAFVVVYTAIFGAGVFYLLKLMREGPAAGPVGRAMAEDREPIGILRRLTAWARQEG